jgi:hypothetical protein
MVAIAVVKELTLLSTENVALVLKVLGSVGMGLGVTATGTYSNRAPNRQRERLRFSFRLFVKQSPSVSYCVWTHPAGGSFRVLV